MIRMDRQWYEDTRKEWNDMYDPKASEAIWGVAPANYVVTKVAKLWRQEGVSNILILPCGDGRNVFPFAIDFPNIMACDSSGNALEILQNRIKKNGIKIHCQEENIYNTYFDHNRFDAVLSWDILSHLPSPDKAIKEMLRVLSPGGIFVGNFFADDDRNIFDASMEHIGPRESVSRTGQYYCVYSRQDVEALCQKLGVQLKSIDRIEWNESPHPGYRNYSHNHVGYVIVIKK